MKTNQVMIRKMGPYDVEQRTKDSFFNATALMRLWNETTGSKKNINHYLDLVSTKEFFKAIIEDDPEIRNAEKPMNYIVSKSKAKTISTGGKIAGEVWLNPIAFIDFAMWLNPSYKVKVIKFVYDQMIAYRKKSGDAYKELAAAISIITPKSYMQDVMSKIGRSINIIVKGRHQKNLRNQYGDEQSQIDYMALEKKLAMLINEGFIRSLADLENYLRKLMADKLPKIQQP